METDLGVMGRDSSQEEESERVVIAPIGELKRVIGFSLMFLGVARVKCISGENNGLSKRLPIKYQCTTCVEALE